MTPELQEYIKNWLYRANEDVSVIQTLSNENIEMYSSTICFHCQQAVEKFLKAFLVFHHIDFPKTHDVDFLLNKCLEIDSNNFKNIYLDNLTEFGVNVRYPDDFYLPDVIETRKYIEIAINIKKIVTGLIFF